MTTLVYQFHCEPPTGGADLLRAQLLAAHRYQNDHIAIERVRRAAIRARLEQLPSVRSALDGVKAATRSDRRAAREAMASGLRVALTLTPSQRALCRLIDVLLVDCPLDTLPHAVAMARIERLAAELRRGARAITTLHWGSYQDVEASADQIRRSIPLYDPKAEPNDPRFRHSRPGEVYGQVAVHTQNRTLTVAQMLACKDQWVRLELRPMRDPSTRRGRRRYGDLHIRIGSEGRAPVWAVLPIQLDRAIPDLSSVEWVRVSCRRDGPRERWSCEMTVELPPGMVRPREMPRDRHGAVAVVLEWVEEDGRVRAARWADDEGASGEVWLDEYLVKGLRKPEGIRSVRDLLCNELKTALLPRLRAYCHLHPQAPGWLREAAANGYQWRSPSRFVDLLLRWRREKQEDPRDAYEMLDAWWLRNAHLYEYETGARRGSLGARKDLYRVTAARWAARYRVVILEKRNLSYEARRPDEPGVAEQSLRQLAGVYELAGALRNAFGPASVWEAPRRPDCPVDEDGDPLPELGADSLVDRWREAGSPSPDSAAVVSSPGSAWARRKAKKRERVAEERVAEERVAGGAAAAPEKVAAER